jgi:3'(2'), 5'-bisphosphate nucleotidase
MVEIEKINEIAINAGKAIMEIYDRESSLEVDYKADSSPLTLADKAAHQVIQKALEELYPEIPIISEEGKDIPFVNRSDWKRFWLVDPLDGTKEFIKKNKQFTVNIALIENNQPVLGVIYAPALETLYYGSKGRGAYKIKGGKVENISVSGRSEGELTAVRSGSHASPEEDEVLERFNVKNSISKGSSLKFCMVAEGTADIYYRFGPTMEWDTGAGHAILEAAGGRVYLGSTMENPFIYNKENLLNGSFLGVGF